MSYRRDEVALTLLGHIWDIHFPKGRPYNDEQFKLLCRDSYVMADVFEEVGNLRHDDLVAVGQPPRPSAEPAKQMPAAEAVVEAVQ